MLSSMSLCSIITHSNYQKEKLSLPPQFQCFKFMVSCCAKFRVILGHRCPADLRLDRCDNLQQAPGLKADTSPSGLVRMGAEEGNDFCSCFSPTAWRWVRQPHLGLGSSCKCALRLPPGTQRPCSSHLVGRCQVQVLVACSSPALPLLALGCSSGPHTG